MLLALTIGCTTTPQTDTTDYLIVGIRVGPSNLDPRQGNDIASTRVAALVFSSLMAYGDDLRAHPMLAERLDNPDPLTYIAHLRHGVKFHDGHELTAKDVVYTFGAFLEPDFISPYKGAYRVMASVRAVDDYTVEFKLREPFAAFPTQLVSAPPVVPYGATGMDVHPIGTGPYRFVRHAVDDHVVLERFDDYFGGPAANPGIVLKVIPDDTMLGLELRKRSIDLAINDINPDIVHGLEQRGDVRVARGPGLDFSYIGFNLQDPIVRDRRVRQAVGFALDRDAIVKYLRRDLAKPAFGLMPPNGWAFEPNVFVFTHDPARSQRLLDEAGYRDPDGDGPLPRLALTLKIGPAEEIRLQATAIQRDLAAVGIALDIRSQEAATLFADLVKGSFQMANPQWVGGAVLDPDILRRVFHSQQVPPAGFNRGRYVNPEVDRLLDVASTALTEAERRRYYGRVQQIVAEDAPYIPVWNRVNALVAQPGLTNLRINPTGDFTALKDVKKM